MPIQKHAQHIVGDFQSLSGYVHRQTITDPAAASATAVLAATAQTDAVQNITEGITNPVTPRNLTVKGNASGNAGNVVITGTNIRGEVITETIALSGASEVAGNKAFKTVTNIQLPVEVHAGTDTVSVGIGVKIALDRKYAKNEVLTATCDGVRETTFPTVAVSSSAIESNTISFNTAPNGSRDYTVVAIATEVGKGLPTTS